MPSYSYGPVPSRRLGRSLGINNIPAKVCTYSCVDCQVGRTTRMQNERRFFYEPEDIVRDVQERLIEARKKSGRVDYLTFVPDGEPTLDVNLGGEILSLKIDAVREAVWRRINRSHAALRLSVILNGIRACAEAFAGKPVTETMLVRGLNDSDDCMGEVAGYLGTLKPSRSYLSVPTRPPCERRAHGPDEAALNRIYQLFAARVNRVEYLIGYEGDAFAFTGDIGKDILSTTAVHPMREEAVSMLLSRAQSSWELVDRLIAQGDLAKTEFDGHIYYLRSPRKNSEAAPWY